MKSRTLTLFSAIALAFTATALPPTLSAQESAGAKERPKAQSKTETQEPSEADQPLGLPSDLNAAQLSTLLDLFAEQEEIKALRQTMIDEILVYGEPEPEWNKKGVYLPDAIAQRGGKLSDHILINKDFPPSIQRLGNKPPDIPEDFLSFELKPGKASQNSEVSTLGIAPFVWLDISANYTRNENAQCYTGFERVRLLTRKHPSDWTIGEFGIIGLFYAATLDVQDLPVCVVYKEDSGGLFTSLVFSPNGEPLTTMNAEKLPVAVVPASQSAALISELDLSEMFEAMLAGEEP